MGAGQAEEAQDMSPQELDPYIDLEREEIARIVLCLLVEEGLKARLAIFRLHDLPSQPLQGLEEFVVARRDVVPVGHRSG